MKKSVVMKKFPNIDVDRASCWSSSMEYCIKNNMYPYSHWAYSIRSQDGSWASPVKAYPTLVELYQDLIKNK